MYSQRYLLWLGLIHQPLPHLLETGRATSHLETAAVGLKVDPPPTPHALQGSFPQPALEKGLTG